MVSAFFTKANVAAAIGVMLFLISYLPYIIYTQFRQTYTIERFHASVSLHCESKFGHRDSCSAYLQYYYIIYLFVHLYLYLFVFICIFIIYNIYICNILLGHYRGTPISTFLYVLLPHITLHQIISRYFILHYLKLRYFT